MKRFDYNGINLNVDFKNDGLFELGTHSNSILYYEVEDLLIKYKGLLVLKENGKLVSENSVEDLRCIVYNLEVIYHLIKKDKLID